MTSPAAVVAPSTATCEWNVHGWRTAFTYNLKTKHCCSSSTKLNKHQSRLMTVKHPHSFMDFNFFWSFFSFWVSGSDIYVWTTVCCPATFSFSLLIRCYGFMKPSSVCHYHLKVLAQRLAVQNRAVKLICKEFIQ